LLAVVGALATAAIADRPMRVTSAMTVEPSEPTSAAA
jgi:hypothetical protein